MAHEAIGFSEVRYDATTGACTMLVGLYKAFEREIGKEQALRVLEQYADSLGAYYADQLKNLVGGNTPTAGDIALYMATQLAAFGCKFTYEEQSKAVKLRVEDCPMAGAYAALGLDRDAGHEFCHAFATRVHAGTCKAVGWSFEVTDYRERWNGTCQETLRTA